jgi:hypothetical protein
VIAASKIAWMLAAVAIGWSGPAAAADNDADYRSAWQRW